MEQHKDVLVIGAGAAGMMCAMEAGRRKKRVAILEHNDRPGKKIRISGGGRCNFTNLDVSADNYVSANPHFCKSALARYTPYDFLELVARHGIAYHERLHGQLFCNESAQQIIDMLCRECDNAGVEMALGCEVQQVQKQGDLFIVSTSRGEWTAPALVVATGGLSIPKIGATGLGYRIAEQFGLATVETRPALVPFTWNERDKHGFSELSGISFAAEVSCKERSFQEQLLLTHRGLSGPVILQISLHWSPGETISINLLPDVDVRSEILELQQQGRSLQKWLRDRLSKRFVQSWGDLFLPSAPLQQLGPKEIDALCAQLTGWDVMPNGTEGYRTAEATAGGVDTNELSSKTMESRRVSGLYFVGEVVDVTGWLGGYNFQWAWASAHVAGKSV
ncbi:MAG: NAD(P)/FAD-dependent oxidoreductase [Myxococcales bacterium]|nr:NAD(P)/FAD-dependent oxidoreductase [Myxococcales bacterium]